MSIAINPPIRVVALIGALVLTAAAAFVLLMGRGALGAGSEAPVTAGTPSTPLPHKVPAITPRPTPKAVRRPPSGFPAVVDRALRYNRVVVVTVYMPKAAVDAVVKAEAKAGAKSSRAGYVAISARSEKALARLVSKTGVIPGPAVLIVRRPGVVSAMFSVTDRATIAQAVAEARR